MCNSSGGAVQLHVICQERFDTDWRAFARGVAPRSHRPRDAAASGTEGHRSNDRSTAAAAQSGRRGLAASRLSRGDAEWVRQRLYPWDSATHRLLCGSTTAAGPSRRERKVD